MDINIFKWKFSLHTKFLINWLKKIKVQQNIKKGHQSPIHKYGQICIMDYAHKPNLISIGYEIMKVHQRSKKVTKRQFMQLIILYMQIIPTNKILHQLVEKLPKVT